MENNEFDIKDDDLWDLIKERNDLKSNELDNDSEYNKFDSTSKEIKSSISEKSKQII